jgi:hypothetical protein
MGTVGDGRVRGGRVVTEQGGMTQGCRKYGRFKGDATRRRKNRKKATMRAVNAAIRKKKINFCRRSPPQLRL